MTSEVDGNEEAAQRLFEANRDQLLAWARQARREKKRRPSFAKELRLHFKVPAKVARPLAWRALRTADEETDRAAQELFATHKEAILAATRSEHRRGARAKIQVDGTVGLSGQERRPAGAGIFLPFAPPSQP